MNVKFYSINNRIRATKLVIGLVSVLNNLAANTYTLNTNIIEYIKEYILYMLKLLDLSYLRLYLEFWYCYKV